MNHPHLLVNETNIAFMNYIFSKTKLNLYNSELD